MTQDTPMTDTPEPVASNAALIERMNQTIREWEADENSDDWWQYQRDFAEALQLVSATRPDADIVRQLVEVVEWYGGQARLARLIHSEGDAGRHALAEDGGKRARKALTTARAAGYGGDHG